MNVAIQTIRASVLLFSVDLGASWRNEAAFRQACGLSDPLYHHVTALLEGYKGMPLFQRFAQYREERRQMALSLRGELERLCAQLLPEEAMAFVATFLPARRRGYSRKRVAGVIGKTVEQTVLLEKRGENKSIRQITADTPLLYHLVNTQPSDTQLKRILARHDPDFDLRSYMSPPVELRIRQTLHRGRRERVQDLLSLFDQEERDLASLVLERIRFETLGG